MSVGAIRTRFFPLLAIVLLFATIAGAQNFRGGINGIVTDQGGASIPGAQANTTFPTFRLACTRFRPQRRASRPSKFKRFRFPQEASIASH
jgi:hypothetical protein